MMYNITGRPKVLSEVAGHKKAIQEIKNFSKSKSFPQSILFEGPSGTGKGCLTNIIAKTINCAKPIKNKDGSYDPCNICESCKDIDSFEFRRDVHYFNCAKSGKEDIESIEKIVDYYPQYDSSVIVILDEFQDLASQGAKRATLDLLEKERKDVYFIASTMEVEKIDKAIRTRCYPFKLRSPNSIEIAEYLFKLTQQVGLPDTTPTEFYENVLFSIAENCEHSIREASLLLQKAIMGEYFTEVEIREFLLTVTKETIMDVTIGLLEHKKEPIMFMKKNDTKEYYYRIVKMLNNAMFYKLFGELDDQDDFKTDQYKAIIQQPALDQLYNTLTKVEITPFFREVSFWKEIFAYYNISTTIEKPLLKRVPVVK